MIKLSVYWPNQPDKWFNYDYYVGKHMQLCHDRLDPMGMVKSEVEKGVDTDDGPATYMMVGALYFNSKEEMDKALAEHGEALDGDTSNYSAIEPIIQISEIVG